MICHGSMERGCKISWERHGVPKGWLPTFEIKKIKKAKEEIS